MAGEQRLVQKVIRGTPHIAGAYRMERPADTEELSGRVNVIRDRLVGAFRHVYSYPARLTVPRKRGLQRGTQAPA
jgi:hypothetical protein